MTSRDEEIVPIATLSLAEDDDSTVPSSTGSNSLDEDEEQQTTLTREQNKTRKIVPVSADFGTELMTHTITKSFDSSEEEESLPSTTKQQKRNQHHSLGFTAAYPYLGFHEHDLGVGARHDVYMSIEIIQVRAIDTVNQTVGFRFNVTLTWMGTKKDFEAYQNKRKTGHPDKLTPEWSPGCPDSPNMVKEDAKMPLEDAYIVKLGGNLMWRQKFLLDGEFSESFELESYPFDTQEFPFRLGWDKYDMRILPSIDERLLTFDLGKMALGEWVRTTYTREYARVSCC